MKTKKFKVWIAAELDCSGARVSSVSIFSKEPVWSRWGNHCEWQGASAGDETATNICIEQCKKLFGFVPKNARDLFEYEITAKHIETWEEVDDKD